VTVGGWLNARAAAPPSRLAARIELAVRDQVPRSATDATESLLDACESLLRDVVARAAAGRESALDLLAADALATYAFEAAADVPASLEEHAREAMRRIGALAIE
jgi:uncharacterized membrane protein